VKLKFTEAALVGIARKAYQQKTGARGLRAILESIMLNIMYDIPSQPDVKEVMITEDVIQGKGEPIKVFEHQKGVKPAIGS
jgi:ATP-dependent Clp protease ATP-binding subunit ClpX